MQIRRVSLNRFRCLASLEWEPSPGINCLIGPGDSGKTSILDAISVALAPAPAGPASESDFYRRRIEDGFEIELFVGQLSAAVLESYRLAPLWGWRTGEEPREAPVEGYEPVLRLVVRGTQDLEIDHRLVLPNREEQPFGVERRRALGLCLFGSGRGANREFRMSRGSLLERVVGREELRGAAARAVRDAAGAVPFPERIYSEMRELRERLDRVGVAPGDLSLGLLSPPGQNLLGYLGLLVGDDSGTAIPLAFHGQGTQQLAMFQMALGLATGNPIAILDELEVGLEPYRQRQLVHRLREVIGSNGQAFITTHSPTVLSELRAGELQRVAVTEAAVAREDQIDSPDDQMIPSDEGRRVRLTALPSSLESVKRKDPEALIARIPIICEGATEVGMVRTLLEPRAEAGGATLDALGVRLVDGGGHHQTLKTIKSLHAAGLDVAGFVDEETELSGTRAELRRSGIILCSFPVGRCTEIAIANTLPVEDLDRLLDVEGKDGAERRVSRLQAIGDALELPGRRTIAELISLSDEARMRDAYGRAAHTGGWFKDEPSGAGLGRFLSGRGLPDPLETTIASLWQAIASYLGIRAATG